MKIVLLNFLVFFYLLVQALRKDETFHCSGSRSADFAWLAARSLLRLDCDLNVSQDVRQKTLSKLKQLCKLTKPPD